MALQSKLFNGDAKLNACLNVPMSHITLGAVGEHVSKIQKALILIDKLQIDANELSSKKYGQSTASAVLSYKTKRKIINFSYQRQADSIVGQMTIDWLDKDMVEYEKNNQPTPPAPTPEPLSNIFSIRCGAFNNVFLQTEPPGVGSYYTGGQAPQWYQVIDVTNQIKATYRFVNMRDESPISMNIPNNLYQRLPRNFTLPQPRALSQLNCECRYTTSTDRFTKQPVSQLELQLPGLVIIPMFLHIREPDSVKESILGSFRFDHFGFD